MRKRIIPNRLPLSTDIDSINTDTARVPSNAFRLLMYSPTQRPIDSSALMDATITTEDCKCRTTAPITAMTCKKETTAMILKDAA